MVCEVVEIVEIIPSVPRYKPRERYHLLISMPPVVDASTGLENVMSIPLLLNARDVTSNFATVISWVFGSEGLFEESRAIHVTL
ncbi:MAG: hypothetical protein EB833_00270 [Thaumarchaeota archaeon S13]|nr:MAG: hypothetical protein EB833_00270 [Thaumarchaeota archaeon S13]